MTPRKPIALVVVCAAHALLGWALLSLAKDPMPSSAGARVQEALRLVSVRLVPQPATAAAPIPIPIPMPMPMRHADAAQARSAPTLPVQRAVAADNGRLAPWPGLAPAPAAAATSATAEPVVQAGAPPAAATVPEPVVAAATTPAQPAPPAPPVGALHRSEAPPTVVAQADRRQCPPAPHPAALRERGIEGAVLLRVKVDVQGRAADVQLLAGSGWRLFDEAALQQVRACRFVPATQGDQAIDSWVEFPVRFALAG
jgi:protein TonB